MSAVPKQFTLSADEIERFRQDGFLGPYAAFTPQEMEPMRQVVSERVLPTPMPLSAYPSRIRHLDSPTVHALCTAPAIVERMQCLFGPDLMLWASNVFDKGPARPDNPDEYPWHQDLYNWQLEPMLNVSAWLALTPATMANGCVEVIPGSHKRIVPPIRDTDPRHSFRFAGSVADPAFFDESKKIAMVMEPGQFFLFNERTLHHSNPNRTKERRLGLAIRVTTPLVKSYEAWPCMMLSGTDRFGFNRLAAPPTDEPDTRWLAALPPGHDFVFDRPVPGLGWHLPEGDGANRFAWTGPENTAWIDMRSTGAGDRLLRCEVLHALAPKVLDDVRLLVNDQPIQASKRQHGNKIVLDGKVPARVLQARTERIRVSIHVPWLLRPCDVNPGSGDNRKLGLGVSRIALLPLHSAA